VAVSLPTGTVTFLFTDIEGSTRLLQELGDGYRRVQDDQAEIMRNAIGKEEGIVIRTEGDSFFAVFRSALQAVRAVVIAQRELIGHDWTHGTPLRVRMGMHTGEGALGGDDYIGIDVNRAARIAAAAHGGQVLLSDAARALVEESLPHEVGLLDLGEHRLKDFDRPTRLFQITAPELPLDFPPPRTLEVPGNLPTQRTTFVGRARELEALFDLVRRHRLVTLTGPGGTGKTRLAIRAAAELATDFPSGVFFVDLAPISEPALVSTTIATTIGVREETARPILNSLTDHLLDREVLLILDNFEQILEAAPVVGELLDGAPKVKAIVTSRAPLRLAGEQEVSVPPLALPEDESPHPEQISRYEAIALFVERARAVDPAFALTTDNAAAVVEICARVDGLPLALELAASRVRALTPRAIVERLEKRLPLLRTTARDVPERQRTLRAAIAWSYDLLLDSERVLFRRLATFVGGWTLETAEAVADPERELGLETLEDLESLVEKSLVRRLDNGRALRFGMLETIREFGLEQLTEQGEFDLMRARHANAFLRLAEEAAQLVTGRESKAWLDRLEVEHDNLRAAIQWAIESGDVETGVHLGAALWRFWQFRSHLEEGRHWLEALVVMPGARARTAIRAKALLAAGSLAYWQGDLDTAERQYEESLDISRGLRDARGIADGVFNLAFVRGARGWKDSAETMMREARQMYEELNDERQAAFATGGLGMAAFMKDDFESSRRLTTEARDRFEALGDLYGVGLMSGVNAVRSLLSGDLQEAREGLNTSLDAYTVMGNNLAVAVSLEATAVLAARGGRYEVALRLAGAAERIKETARGHAPGALLRLEDPKDLASRSLSPEQMAEAWERGRATPIEAAVALAREELAADDEGRR
jgi:predicted ATPase/class 3 adenylate cyclase